MEHAVATSSHRVNLVAQAAEEESHSWAEDGGDERGGDSGGTGRRARGGLVGGQRDPGEGGHSNGGEDDGAEDLAGRHGAGYERRCERCLCSVRWSWRARSSG